MDTASSLPPPPTYTINGGTSGTPGTGSSVANSPSPARAQVSHSVSPGSTSGRSSSSSINNAPPTPKSSILSQYGTGKRDISVSFKKVSISQNVAQNNSLNNAETLSETNNSVKTTPIHSGHKISSQLNGNSTQLNGRGESNPSIISGGTSIPSVTQPLQPTHRASLINAYSEKKAKKVRFFINSDKFFKGATIAVSSEKFRTLDKLLEHLTRIMCNQVTLPQGVRHIFCLDGKTIECVEELLHGSNYVCSSAPTFKRMDYLKVGQDHQENNWNKMKRETCYLGMGSTVGSKGQGALRRDAFKNSGHSKSFGASKAGANGLSENGEKFQIKPKIIAILRSGLKPRKAVRVLLNNRNTKSFDTLLADLTNTVKLDTGAVRKMFTLDGRAVMALQDFTDAEVFIAYGVDKCTNDDFDLDIIEFRNVQSILKSPELDAKYEKFSSNASPKTSRKKFLSSRQPAKRKRKTSASSKTRESPRNGSSMTTGTNCSSHSGNGSNTAVESALAKVNNELPADHFIPPKEISLKYIVGDIIGDGNFAVVRKCRSRKTKSDFALKIIDKSKCQGKEHMIESEIAILTLVAHPHVIELLEVFDFPDEKYLVTEYVRGGDLFDAIAIDTKYSERVSRRMIGDMTSALKYLHDKMIVHRDIKPENLLVLYLEPEDRGPERLRSLKLGDFGLAQLVSEPLFTVCGTPTYVAPEILAETGYGVKVDVWATGVIMYILLVGFPPFSSRTNNQEELFDQILSGLFEFNSPDWDDITYSAKELISWMLQVDPLQRYSAYEILEHPWIRALAT